ncbi:MAG: DUF11 domain-containing protein [Acidimicrobiia bacterium]
MAALLASLPTTMLRASVADAEVPTLLDTFSRNDFWWIGAAESGQPWQVWSGTAVVAGGAAAASVPGYTLAVADAMNGAGVASMRVPVVSNEFWMIFRASNSGNYWRFGRWQGAPYELQQIAGWALGSPVVTTHAIVQAFDGDRLECSLSTGVTCSVNGSIVVSSADGFNQGATMMGFALADGAAAPTTRIDDVLFQPAAPTADASVSIMTGGESVASGSAASWTVTIANVGTAPAAGTVVDIALPGALEAVVATPTAGSCTVGAGISCSVGTLAAGQSVVVEVSGVASAASGSLELAAVVATASADPNELNDAAAASLPIDAPVPPGAVVIDNFARPDAYSLGAASTGHLWQVWNGTARVVGRRALNSEAGYMLSVVDSGAATGSAHVTVPVISSDFWLVARGSNSGNYWRFGSSGGAPYALEQVRDWAMAAPPIELHSTVQPAAGDALACRYLNGITCSVNGVDVASSADSFNSSATFVGFAAYGPTPPAVRFDDFRAATAPPAANLRVEVTPSVATVVAGEPMSWSVTVRNNSETAAHDVVATAAAPSALAPLTASSSTGSCAFAAGEHACSIGDLAPGGVATLTFEAVAPAAIGAYPLAVEAAPIVGDGDRSDNRASSHISVRVLATPGEQVVDAFDRPDATLLGQESNGRPWEQWRGTIGVSGEAAVKTDALPGSSVSVIDPGFTFGTMNLTVPAGASEGFGVLFRARDRENYYLLAADSSGYYRVQKMLNGRFVGLQFNAIRANVAPADGDRIRLVLRPDDGWFVSVNGVHILDGGDVDLLGEYRFGLSVASPSVRVDDVRISQTITTGITTQERFDHPQDATLELRHPTSGTQYVWLAPNGYWVADGGTGMLASPGYGIARLETGSQLATVSTTILSAGDEAWLVFRHSDDGSYLRFGYSSLSDGRYTIERVNALGESEAVPGGVLATGHQRAAGDALEIRQELDGSITGFVNGELVASATDAVHNVMGTAYGIAGVEGVRFDDVAIVPK